MKIDKVTKMIEQPEVWLCHRDYANQGKICNISPIEDLKIYVAANAVDEVSFSLHKYNDGIEFEYWDQLKDLKVICVDGFGYFEIAVDVDVEDETKKVVTGISIEAELGQINIDGMEINGDTDRNDSKNWDSSGNYIQTVIYNESDQEHSLLHRLMSNAPHWQLGDIADTITENDVEVSTSLTHRTFNFDGTNIYDALQEIATELDVVFTFNTVTRSVNMYDLNKIGEDTAVYISTQNLAEDFTCSSNKDNVKNCFKVLGGDDLINAAVRAINPSGSNRIVYVSPEQKEDMSDGLKAKLQKYEENYDLYKDEYAEVCNLLYDAIDEVDRLENTMFPNREPAAETKASEQVAKLTASEIGTIPVESLTTLYETGAKKAILTIAQLKIDYRYEVEIESGAYNSDTNTWTGKFKVTNTANKTDSAVSANEITLTFVEDQMSSLQSKIDELLCEVDIEDTDIETFRNKLKEYSKKYLDDYASIYEECANTLVGKGYANKDDVEPEFYNLYYSYWEKWKACEAELEVREAEITAAKEKQARYEDSVETYHEILDFEFHMGDYYKEFCLYRREDTYQNDNYISDGLSNSELLQNAQKLVEVATKELYKASLFQTTYTANLNNLFTNPIYEPFYNHFDLFNWIHADIDDKQVMLRLIGITYDFSSIEKIEVEFSEQVRNGNGISDLESILNQSKSMATTFSSTVKQAQNGQEASLEFDMLKQEGLNSALMNIKNSNNEEVVIDNCGINCRSKDQNDQYDQHQLRITGKNIVMTDDDWETARLAIGLMTINKQECYGVVADCLIGDLIVGQTLLIANSSGTFLVDKDGIIVKNMKLDMSNADGTRRIVIDPELDSILSIYTNSKQVFYVDTNGNMCMLGNLYVNNNNMYLKVDMTDENIIEVGYGEITGTGNEGESGSGSGGVSTGNYVSMPVYRSLGVNITDATLKPYITEDAIFEKNGQAYFLDIKNKIIKRYNKSKNVWDSITTITDGSTPQIFIKTNRTDNNLYICSLVSTGVYSILRFNLDEYICYTVCTISCTNYKFYDIYLDNSTLYISHMPSSSSSVCYLKSYTLPSDTDDIQENITYDSNVQQSTTRIARFMPYNNSVYAILINNSNYYGLLAKITDISTLSHKIISNLDQIKTNYVNYDQYCSTIMDDKLYVFCTYATDSNKYFVCDLKTEEVLEYDGSVKLECGLISSSKTGNLVYNDGEKIHLYNYVYVGRGTSYNTYYYTNNNYIAHYIYDDNNTTLVNKNFKELNYGKNFRISSQNDYITIGDVIYEVESYYTYYKGTARRYNTNIRKLDTSDSENDWEIVYTFATNYDEVCTPIQSNSKDKIYFITNGHTSTSSYICYYDLNTNKIVYYYSGKATDDEDFAVGDSIVSYESFGYLDETTMTYYTNRQKLTKVDIATNASTPSTVTHTNALSNQIYLDGYFYFVGVDGYLKLYRTSIEDGSTETLCILAENSITEDRGFSIFYYNGKIQVFYSDNGVLSKTRYVYTIADDTLETLYDVFQDLGLHNVDTAGSYQTCFLPMLTTSTGVHIFVGYPSFTPYVTNGGYKHYVYTEGSTTDTDENTEIDLSTGEWKSVSTLPYEFYNGSAVVLNGEIHILNGTSHYKWDGSTWVSVSTLPYSFGYGSAMVLNNEIHILGGHTYTHNHYKWDGSSWISVSTLPFAYCYGSSVVYNNEIHIMGGSGGGTAHYKWDGTTWTSVSTLPYILCYSSAIVFNNEIHIMGGSQNGTQQYHYKFDSSLWTEVSTLPCEFYKGSAMLYNNQIHILGSGNSSYQTNHYMFDGTTWTSVSTLPYNFSLGASVVYNNKIYILGGSGNTTNHYVFDVEIPESSPSLPSVDNPTDGKIFYITNEGDGYFYGTVYAKDGVFSGDIIARSLTLGDGVTLSTSDISGMDDYVITDVGLGDINEGAYCKISKNGLLTANNAIIDGQINAGKGYIGGWEIADSGLKSAGFDTASNGICLDKSGEIRSKGTWYSSDGWFARLCSGKWIFGYYDSSQSDPFIPPEGTPYSDISVNGIYICSKSTILNNVSNRYLFCADAANDIVSITSNSSSPALTITNDGEGTCLEVRNNSCTYDNKALSLGVTVLNTDNTTGMGYITVFGEGEGGTGRIIMRPDQNIKSSDTENPANYTNSACGTYYYPWGTMSCNQLYVEKTSVTSDAKLKTPIKLIDNSTALEFIKGLIPREYYFKDSTNKRHHMGFYAQEVNQLAKDLKLGDMAIYEAIMSKDNDETEYYYDESVDDEHLHWTLNYNEFIAPMVSAIQGLSKENEELKDRIEKLEGEMINGK